MDKRTSRLSSLYAASHKHAAYQALPPLLMERLRSEGLELPAPDRSRYEEERLAFIGRYLPLVGRQVVDIGGNTGYFSIRAAELGAREALCVEGNSIHAEFVALAAQVLELEDRLKVSNAYFSAGQSGFEKADVVLLLNVLHHLGDDFGSNALGRREALSGMMSLLNDLARKTGWAVVQIGFNWKGDVKEPLFEFGEKYEMIEFLTSHTVDCWELVAVGIAEREPTGRIVYSDLSERNIARNDALGEFLNRPIFVMKSKVFEETHP